MTANTDAPPPPIPKHNSFWSFLDKLPGAKFLKNQKIGVRLLLGFGTMILLTFLVAGIGYFGSVAATEGINSTIDLRFPVAIVTARAQANLLRTLSDVRGYLALGQDNYLESYAKSRQDFENDLAVLQQQSPNLSPDNQQRLTDLQLTFSEWSKLPDTLFDLRDDQLEREPAYKLLATDVSLLAGNVLIDINNLIKTQAQSDPSAANLELLGDMANFQGTFASMFSAMRGYVTTRNRIFRQEYEVNETANEFAWQRLLRQRNRLTESQQVLLDDIAQQREEFLQQPEQVFAKLEGERWREDLYLFTANAVPLTEKMQRLLAEMNQDQQEQLIAELNKGRVDLNRGNQLILAAGLIALVLGIALAFIFRENIAGPVVRLTDVADRIRGGDLETKATVEAGDEIGTLALTFNNMTGQLNSTLFQVRKEKKRADDLLNVVIPIGVELSSEKDFNRLLENMLVEAKEFCHARAGVLYLNRNDELQYVIIRNDGQDLILGGTSNNIINIPAMSLKDAEDDEELQNVAVKTAISGEPININSTVDTTGFDTGGPKELLMDVEANTYAVSQLNVPIKNSNGDVLGVMQLLDPLDVETGEVIAFDGNIQQMMVSFSSLAAAALEAYIREQALRSEIRQLRIEIDETKRQQQVSEIVDTDFFSDLQARAKEIRGRAGRRRAAKSDAAKQDGESTENSEDTEN